MGFIADSRGPNPTSSAPSTVKGQGQGQRSGEGYELSTLHIILISFGGVVFFIGIFVIIVLLKSRKKMCADNPGGAATRTNIRGQSPIFVIGQGNRQGRGGDNPAFCRADEASGSGLPSSRNPVFTASQTRLPTYDEVMSGRVSTTPVSRSRPRSPQRSNTRAHSHPHRHTAPYHNEQEGSRQASGRDTPANPDPEAVSARTTSRGRNSEVPLPSAPPRYAHDYPSCYWEEVPPPPYTAVSGTGSGRCISVSGNCGMVRAMGGGGPGSRDAGGPQSRVTVTGGVVERRGEADLPAGSLSAYENGSIRGRNPCGRAPLAVPTPTVLSPAPSPALSVRESCGGGSERNCNNVTPASTIPVVMLSSSSSTSASSSREGAIPTAPYPPVCESAFPSNLPGPLASSSPAIPRRQLTPAAAPALTQYLLLAAEGGAQNSGSQRTCPQAVLDRSRSRSDVGQGRCYGNAVTGSTAARASPSRLPRVPSAPMARFDIEL